MEDNLKFLLILQDAEDEEEKVQGIRISPDVETSVLFTGFPDKRKYHIIYLCFCLSNQLVQVKRSYAFDKIYCGSYLEKSITP